MPIRNLAPRQALSRFLTVTFALVLTGGSPDPAVAAPWADPMPPAVGEKALDFTDREARSGPPR